MSEIVVLGAGWGTALAMHMARVGHTVHLWTPFEKEIEEMRATRENPRLLPGVKIEEDIDFTTDLSVARRCDIVMVAVPSMVIGQTAERLREVLDGCSPVIACFSKGLEDGTKRRLSEVLHEGVPWCKIAVVSGLSHAEEVARGVPTSLVSASCDLDTAEYMQDSMMSDRLRIYTNQDMVGVELGGALKNIIALAAGITDGLELGDNTKAALITRGLSEIATLGVKMGAKRETFAGLTGIGDLIVTCTSMHSRNRRCGILIGKGLPADEAMAQIGMTVEGYHATKTAHELSLLQDVEMPIVTQCYNVLYGGLAAGEALKQLMARPKKHEHEHTYLG